MNDDCVFCKIISKEIPTQNIRYEDSDIVAFDSINPVAKTHILIVPKKHITSFLEINDDFDFSKIVKAAQKIIVENKIELAYKLVFNGGKFQTIQHLHWHLLSGDLKEI